MQYTIREIEGVENFSKQYSANYIEGMSMGYLFSGRLMIKQGTIKDGDEIKVELTEYTTESKQQIKTVTIFKVVEHDSFLLKLVKS